MEMGKRYCLPSHLKLSYSTFCCLPRSSTSLLIHICNYVLLHLPAYPLASYLDKIEGDQHRIRMNNHRVMIPSPDVNLFPHENPILHLYLAK